MSHCGSMPADLQFQWNHVQKMVACIKYNEIFTQCTCWLMSPPWKCWVKKRTRFPPKKRLLIVLDTIYIYVCIYMFMYIYIYTYGRTGKTHNIWNNDSHCDDSEGHRWTPGPGHAPIQGSHHHVLKLCWLMWTDWHTCVLIDMSCANLMIFHPQIWSAFYNDYSMVRVNQQQITKQFKTHSCATCLKNYTRQDQSAAVVAFYIPWL